MNYPQSLMPIDKITLPKRRRRDYGDIDGLADSIQRWGLLHPLIVDDDGVLVAGERRLKACRKLGFLDVPVRSWGELTEEERHELELEENLQRKDLTPAERSRNLLELVKVARIVDERNYVAPRNENRGRPDEPGSLRRVAERVGVDPATVHRAQEHVAIIEEVPEIMGASQAQALTIKRNLDALPPPQRTAAIQKIKQNDPDTLATLAGLPPIPKDSVNPHAAVAEKRAARKWLTALSDIRMRVNSVRDHGGIAVTTAQWTYPERAEVYEEIDRLIRQLSDIRDELEGLIHAA